LISSTKNRPRTIKNNYVKENRPKWNNLKKAFSANIKERNKMEQTVLKNERDREIVNVFVER